MVETTFAVVSDLKKDILGSAVEGKERSPQFRQSFNTEECAEFSSGVVLPKLLRLFANSFVFVFI